MNLIEMFYPIITKKLHYKQKDTIDEKITRYIVQNLKQHLWDTIEMYYNLIGNKILELFKNIVLENYCENSEAYFIATPVKGYITDVYIEIKLSFQ